MTDHALFTPWTLGGLTLKNRIVMAPMTRSRAVGNVPNEAMARYYGDRADAGLLITEGTAPSADGLGYARIPGIFTEAQIEGWRLVTDAVHARGGAIFVQLMHCGRISHPLNMPEGAQVVAPSALQPGGTMYTDAAGPQPYPVPVALDADGLARTRDEFVQAARNAIAAGFDGVELHGANGYLLDQFTNPQSNQRTDAYGGDAAGRLRFPLEVARAVADAIGAERVGYRVSPHGAFNDLLPFEGTDETFTLLAQGLSDLGIAYIHVADHASMGAPTVDPATKAAIRKAFRGTYVLSGGYDTERAQADLAEGKGDLVAFGRPFLANPDLIKRLATGAPLNQPNYGTLYTPGEPGYNDYPTLEG